MNFKKFTSIENHYRQKYINYLREHGFDKKVWIGHEKIHGANFSFWTNGKEVRVASRTQFVDGTFYKCSEVIDRYKDNIMSLKNTVYPDANEIAVFGELYGPGIQSGVFYGTQKDFMGFEIQVDGKVESIMMTKLHLAKHDIPQVPFKGIYNDLDEALEAENDFTSTAYRLASNFDPGDEVSVFTKGENIAEGLVLIPVGPPLYTRDGSRVIIKSKNDKFTEKNKRKARDSKPREANPYVDIAEPFVNQNRLDAVLSKFGEPTPKDFGKIIKLMVEDVMDDMVKEDELHPNWKKIDDQKHAGKGIATAVTTFLKRELLPEL